MHTREHILPLLRDALRAIGAPADQPLALDVPRGSGPRGDLSTGVALSLAGRLGAPPRPIAEAIVAALPADDPAIATVEVAGPGFINITFTPEFHALHIRRALDLGDRYGRAGERSSRRVIVEQAAAPASGPDDGTTVRGAVVAHAIATLLKWRGDEVTLRLDERLLSTEPAMRSIIEALGTHGDRRNGAGTEAERRVLVIDARSCTEEERRMGDGGDRSSVVPYGALSLRTIAGEARGTSHRGVAALNALGGAIGPAPLRLLLLGERPGSPLRPDPATIARHTGASPLYAAPYILVAIDALLRAAAAIAPFDPHAAPVGLPSPAALRLARHGLLLPDAIERSAAELDPSILVGYLAEAATLAWPLVGERPLISRSGQLDTSRFPLLAFAATIVGNGLAALGGRREDERWTMEDSQG